MRFIIDNLSLLFLAIKMQSDISAYQFGNPHRLNVPFKPKEITFDPYPEVTIKVEPIVQVQLTKPQKLNDYLDRMKYLASQS
jgi:hypothetical protein